MTRFARLIAVVAALGCGIIPTIARGSSPVFAILGMTSTDSRHVWVLGTSCAPNPNRACSHLVVRGSADGGRRWPIALTVPARPSYLGKGRSRPSVSRLQYATPRDAYVFDPALLTSHDGGRTWSWQRGIGAVETLAPVGDQVWAVSDLCAHAGACPAYLYRSPAGHDAWRRSPLPLRSPTGATQIVAATSGQVWILAQQESNRAQINKSTLIETTTFGRTWSRLPDPCSAAESFIDRLATNDGTHLWIVCGGQPSAGGELFSLYRSPDGGKHWHAVASNNRKPRVPHFVYGGYVDSLAVTGAQTAWFSLDRGTLYTTTDGGRSWHSGIHQNVDPTDATVGPVLFANTSDGWVAAYPNLVFRTTDGGRSWQRTTL